jgi:hypothetical protein
MVSMPTGLPRGRPRKMRETTPAKRGRPPGKVKLLAENPWRYLYAVTQLTIEKSRDLSVLSELEICRTFAAFMVGRPAKVGEVVTGREGKLEEVTKECQEYWQCGSRIPVANCRWDRMPEHNRAYWRTQKPSENWRGRKKVEPTVDNMRRNLRIWREAPITNANRRWLDGMVRVMEICVDGLDESSAVAMSIAEAIGEKEYFDTTLSSILTACGDLRRRGAERPAVTIAMLIDIILPARLDLV